MRHFLSILFILISQLVEISAQQKATWFENINIEKGLSVPNVSALFRDSRGFLWIGTKGGGLNRFDGGEMKIYRHYDNDSLSLCNDRIASILEDKMGFLWIGTEGGISRINPSNGKCRNYTSLNKKLRESFKNYLFKDNYENIWCSNNSGIEQYDSCADRFTTLKYSNFFRSSDLSAFDANGILWTGGCNGLHSFSSVINSWLHYLPYPNAPADQYRNMNFLRVKIDRYNNIWCNTWGGGLLRFHPETKCFEKFLWVENSEFPDFKNIPFDIAETFDGEGRRIFWITTENGIFKFPLEPKDFPSLEKPHDYFDSKSGVGLVTITGLNVMLTDYDENLWIGTGSQGIFRYNSRQEKFNIVKNIKDGIIEHLAFSKNGDILVCGYGDPLVIMDKEFKKKKLFHQFKKKMDASGGKTSWDVVKDEEHEIIYVATFDGLISINNNLNNKHWYPFNPKDSNGLMGKKITNIFPLGNNKLLLGFWKGPLQVFNTLNGKNIHIINKKACIYHKILKLSDGKIWICCENRLLTFDSREEQVNEVTPKTDWKYEDVLQDSKNRTWFATDNGLCLYDILSNHILKRYTIEDGLPSNFISQLCFDKLGRLWLLTDLGVCYFDPETYQCHVLDKADGLALGNLPYKMEQMQDGRICLVFGNSLQIFKPELIKIPVPSKVYITGLKINEKDTLPNVPFEKITEMSLIPGENALTFSYTAIDLQSFGKTNFLYKLEGLQNEWVHAGKNRIASFVNLPAGDYIFHVRPEDAGNDSAYDASLHIKVTDFFWQRTWFKYLLIILVVSLVLRFLIFYYRNKIRIQKSDAKRKEAIYTTRTQIAQDIHDDLGTDLSKISMGASVASMMPDLEKEVLQQKLHSISLEAQEVAQHLRDVVFITNPQFDPFTEVQAYFKEKSSSFLESVGLKAHFDFVQPKINPNVLPEIKRQLFLLLRECLNNIAKHANAKEVNLKFIIIDEIQADNTNYLLEISDNGTGFDPEKTHHFGNGLKSIAKRAEKIDAKLEIISSLGNGTTFRVVGLL